MSKEPIDPELLTLALEYARPILVARTATRAAQALVADLERVNAELRAENERLAREVAELRAALLFVQVQP